VVRLRADAFNFDLKGCQEAADRCVEDTKEKGTEKKERKRVQDDVKGLTDGEEVVSRARCPNNMINLTCFAHLATVLPPVDGANKVVASHT
jgi:hypothetical protein